MLIGEVGGHTAIGDRIALPKALTHAVRPDAMGERVRVAPNEPPCKIAEISMAVGEGRRGPTSPWKRDEVAGHYVAIGAKQI